MGASPPVAVGTLPDGSWLGVATAASGPCLAVGRDERALLARDDPAAAVRRALTALLIVHFEEALDPPPPGLPEATQQDMAELLRWLAATTDEPDERARLVEALDAVEDGLPGETVALRLMSLWRPWAGQGGPEADPPQDPARWLLARAETLLGASG